MLVPTTVSPARRRPRRLARADTRDRVGLGAAAAALGLVLATHLYDFGAERLRLRLLNANSAASWSHLAVSGLLVLATLAALARAARAGRDRPEWSVVGLALALLAVSELTPLHAEIDRISWGKLVYLPLLLALAVALWGLPWAPRSRRAIRSGLLMLVVAYAIHVLGPHLLAALHWRGDGWPYQIKVGLKQGSELAGWLLVAGAIIERPGIMARPAPQDGAA